MSNMKHNTTSNAAVKRPQPFLMGIRDGFPIGMGYFAVAFSLGIIARKAGLNAFMGFFASLFTRASAGEYSGYSMILANASYFGMFLMCIIANLRYLLMNAALTQKFDPKTPLLTRILVGACCTDEIFGISIAYKGYLAPSYAYGATCIAGPMWASGTALGIIAGSILPDRYVSALGVALYGMFIAIIFPVAKENKTVLCAIIVSFILSAAATYAPLIRDMNSGTRTIVLTILISAGAALLKPVADDDPGADSNLKSDKEVSPS